LGLVLGPVLYVLFISFTKRTDSWDISAVLSLDNYIEIFNPVYLPALLQSLSVAFVSTLVCAVLGYPAGLAIANLDSKWSSFFYKANVLPLLFNSMMRITGLIIILRSNGLLDMLLKRLGIIKENLQILYSYPAVIIGMVYVLLPFMIYSVYASASKLKSDNADAARIMGAGPFRVFLDITLPLTMGGLLNGAVLCFIPAMGLYIISSLLGGGKTVLVSNVIEDQLMKVHNLPFTAALSVMLIFLTFCLVLLSKKLDPVARKIRKAERNNEGVFDE